MDICLLFYPSINFSSSDFTWYCVKEYSLTFAFKLVTWWPWCKVLTKFAKARARCINCNTILNISLFLLLLAPYSALNNWTYPPSEILFYSRKWENLHDEITISRCANMSRIWGISKACKSVFLISPPWQRLGSKREGKPDGRNNSHPALSC